MEGAQGVSGAMEGCYSFIILTRGGLTEKGTSEHRPKGGEGRRR